MTTKKATDITFRVFCVGSNMPGYMPDEPPSDYEPIIDEWITPEELEALESYNLDVTIIEAEYRYASDSDAHTIKADDIVDDYGHGGKWYVGKTECGPWVLPR
jgi:hypothetical protein